MTIPKPYDISKRRVLEAYWRVKANRGAAGVDDESIEMFEADLTGNLYKLWNRLSSGSYFPPPVRQVEIPKKNGGVRILGVPTVADRIAQQVAATRIGGDLFGVFHPDSHGYQLGKSAVNAVANTRKRCWEYDWVVEFDIRRAFDELDWDLLRKAIAKHIKDPWCLLYIERWLTASAVSPDGKPVQRTKGVPQGSVIGPVLMNLFMTYAFDKWMEREHPNNPFSRYADDAVAHCRSEAEAKKLLPAISASAKKRIRHVIREWNLPRQTSVSLNELARRYNAHILGWMNYYSHFYKSALYRLYDHIDQKLVRWAQRKYRKLAGKQERARAWLEKVVRRQPRLFVHWLASGKVTVRTMGAV